MDPRPVKSFSQALALLVEADSASEVPAAQRDAGGVLRWQMNAGAWLTKAEVIRLCHLEPAIHVVGEGVK